MSDAHRLRALHAKGIGAMAELEQNEAAIVDQLVNDEEFNAMFAALIEQIVAHPMSIRKMRRGAIEMIADLASDQAVRLMIQSVERRREQADQ